MYNLFIDSNIWLDLYAFSNNDLDNFSKLKDLIGSDIKLIITDQVKNEVSRNREKKIDTTLKNFKLINISFPNLCQGYKEFETLFDSYNTFKENQKKILATIKNDIGNSNLEADKVINNFFSLAHTLITEKSHIMSAKLRFDTGNPPGKDRSYGDAINWELLLDKIPQNEDLFFISGDKDYKSLFEESEINPFLKKEWFSKKSSNIFFYPNLPTFFAKKAKDIQLKNEERKLKLIDDFSKSGSFQRTHQYILSLNQETDWTDEQINLLFMAAIKNDQIGPLVCDWDVGDFYRGLYSKAKANLDSNPDFTDFIKTL